MKYPRVLFTTSTRDDRVHPGHARKMVARMKEMGHDVLYYENIEGGHGGAADNKQGRSWRPGLHVPVEAAEVARADRGPDRREPSGLAESMPDAPARQPARREAPLRARIRRIALSPAP